MIYLLQLGGFWQFGRFLEHATEHASFLLQHTHTKICFLTDIKMVFNLDEINNNKYLMNQIVIVEYVTAIEHLLQSKTWNINSTNLNVAVLRRVLLAGCRLRLQGTTLMISQVRRRCSWTLIVFGARLRFEENWFT